jgi:DNA polymerase
MELTHAPDNLIDAASHDASLMAPEGSGALDVTGGGRAPAMLEITLDHPADFAGWRAAARRLWAAGIEPEAVRWRVGGPQPSLFEAAAVLPADAGASSPACSVPRRFVQLAEQVALHADPGRFALLYRLLVRLARGERRLLHSTTDPDVAQALAMAAAVRRCARRMQALLRFEQVATGQGTWLLAWHEPEHHVVERVAACFVRRCAGMRWSIVTPWRSAHWNGTELRLGQGGRRGDVPDEGSPAAAWRAYHASVVEPIWRQVRRPVVPVARPAVPPVREREAATPQHMAGQPASLAEAREAAALCRACPLWARATATVFGEGPRDAAVMLVGEQPGDQDDREGRPFLGPSGQVLDRALADAGLDRGAVYLTNALKHFKHARRSGRRIQQSPERHEVERCRHWLDTERRLVRPRLVVALGVTAASALLGRPVSLQLERGRVTALEDGSHVLVTAHPSSILRIPDPAAQGREYRRLVGDLLLALPYLRRAA